jgi:hypothetical protein
MTNKVRGWIWILLRRDDAFGFGEGDGDELADAALGHGDAGEAVDARPGERAMR